jgi:hypothetical protein
MNQSVFAYDSYALSQDRKRVDFKFTTNKAEESFEFTESYAFTKPLPNTVEVDRLLKMLHLASGISYYKLFFNSEVEHPYTMSTKEASFWNVVFTNGLGEFMYVNKLPVGNLALFEPQDGQDSSETTRSTFLPKAILGIGGGKDSIVAGELLKKSHVAVDGFILATSSATAQASAVAETMGVNTHIVQRAIDGSLLELQKRPDTHKGHLPISLIFAITGSLVASTLGYSYVVVANESSASIPRVVNDGMPINHQWSKSFEAEKLIQQYLHEHVSSELWYFSAIRPLSSVAVAKIFCNYPKYFKVFTSDNFGFRIQASQRPTSRWSLQSPKSLSSYILLSAWLNKEQLDTIFEYDFFDDIMLGPLFLQLIGLKGNQPLDCVGTIQELRMSLNQAYSRGVLQDSKLMQLAFNDGVIDNNSASIKQSLLPSAENAFPSDLAQILQTNLAKELT